MLATFWCGVLCAMLYLVIRFRPVFFVSKSIKNVPGPPSSRGSTLFGHLDVIWTREIGLTHRDWLAAYGPVVRYSSLFGEQVLILGDVAALNHVLRTNAYGWPKSQETRTIISRLLGKGLIWSEGQSQPWLLKRTCHAELQQNR